MTCPGCGRANDPRRRYCGGCGCNLEPVCRRCSFANERADRFCGGCGELLTAGAPAAAPAPGPGPVPAPLPMPVPAVAAVPAPAVAVAVVPAAPVAVPDELRGLFAAPAQVAEPPRLPDANIAQDDLDRLFGAVP